MLLHMFPDRSFDMRPIRPLSHQSFLADVLLPEVATALIQQDLDIDRNIAVETLHNSRRYGSMLYPGTDTDSDVQTIIEKATSEMRRYNALVERYQDACTDLDLPTWARVTAEKEAANADTAFVTALPEVSGAVHDVLATAETTKDYTVVVKLEEVDCSVPQANQYLLLPIHDGNKVVYELVED